MLTLVNRPWPCCAPHALWQLGLGNAAYSFTLCIHACMMAVCSPLLVATDDAVCAGVDPQCMQLTVPHAEMRINVFFSKTRVPPQERNILVASDSGFEEQKLEPSPR